MLQTKNVHLQFADYFGNEEALPYLYLLSKKLSEGSICVQLDQIDWERLKEEESQLVKFKIIRPDELKKNELVSENQIDKPIVLSGHRLYLQRYYKYETAVINQIEKIISYENQNESAEKLKQLSGNIKNLFKENVTDGTDWQAVAAISAVLNNFTIITGGPGTGKTTTIAKILSLLFELNPTMTVALTAPTGKAAARMAESLKNTIEKSNDFKINTAGLEPSTIHRLLGWKKDSIYFNYNADNPLPHDLLIVDESSMLDVALFSKFLSAVKPGAKLILLGDKNQLAAVEAGSLFGDLCMAMPELNQFSKEKTVLINGFLTDEKSKIKDENIAEQKHLLFEHIIELQHSFRFSDKGGIGKFSKAVIQNQTGKIEEFFEISDHEVNCDTEYSQQKFEEYTALFSAYINEPDTETALRKLNNIRILCAVREGAEGMYALNRKVEKFLQENKLISIENEFYENRPVMVTGNNYELGLFNGDTGIVKDKKIWFLDSENQLKSVLPASLDEIETVFAMTVHKSQGSEFKNVLVVLPKNQENSLLTAELLYTAVTRAKEKVCVQATQDLILSCAAKRVDRSSGIIERLNIMKNN